MKQLLNKLRYVPKRFGIIAALVAAVVPMALMAYGPDRPSYTIEQPADHVTFNSITNNPNYGNEFNFVTVKDAANTSEGGWQDDLNVEPGKEYLVRMYVHNNAADNLNLVAENTRVKANVPTTTGTSVEINGFVSADNATPKEVWDQAVLKSSTPFNVAYVPGSATMYNNVFTSGTALADSIVTSTGAQVGYDKIDGKVPGCFQYAAVVTFKVKVQGQVTPDFDVQKTVRVNGATDKTFKESVAVEPGDKVDYQVYFKNTGDAQLTDVVIRDTLPTGVTYVPGTTWLHNSSGTRQVADGVTSTGLGIGGYMPDGDAYLKFTAQVAANDKLPTCGPNTLKNTASVDTSAGSKSDTADVTVDKECAPEEATYACEALSVTKISRTQFKFTETHSVENATYVRTVFIVRDNTGKEIARETSTDSTFTYTQNTVGTYTVEAQVIVKVGDVEKTATSANCKKPFEVTAEEVKNEYVCTKLELIKKTRDNFEFATTATAKGNVTIKEVKVDFGDNSSAVVDYGTNAKHTYTTPGTYTAVAYVTFSVDGKTVAGVTSDTCKVQVVVEEQPPVEECKPGIPVDDARCEETPTTPETPTELPSTGPAALIGGLFGSSALGLGVHSWLTSRRAYHAAARR